MCGCVFARVHVDLAELKRLCLCQVFREQAVDGETLPLLTEEHLLSSLGLKLGPALKIRSQVHTHTHTTGRLCVCGCARTSTDWQGVVV